MIVLALYSNIFPILVNVDSTSTDQISSADDFSKNNDRSLVIDVSLDFSVLREVVLYSVTRLNFIIVLDKMG